MTSRLTSKQHADPGRVVPGTQRPIDQFYVVSKTDFEADVSDVSPQGLATLLYGLVEDEYAIFTDRMSADQYLTRRSLARLGAERLEKLDTDTLQQIVDAIDPGKVETTIESLNHYCS